MTEPSTIFFPLRSNASALIAGAGIASVRRRILAAALLTDQVILESGLHTSWAGPTGAGELTGHVLEGPPRWQSPRRRGRLTGARHYVAVSRSPESPRRAVVSTEATFSWQATFEPFKGELPRPFPKWLAFGHVTDDREVKAAVNAWKAADRMAELRRYGTGPRPPRPDGQFVYDAILNAGYYDLATGVATGAAISIDRRHALAIATRVEAGDAVPLGGAYALEVLLPVGFTWSDLPMLRRDRRLADYRAILREIEAEALSTSGTAAELEDRIRREHGRRLEAAASSRLGFGGRVVLTSIGFVVGAAADVAAPVAGGGHRDRRYVRRRRDPRPGDAAAVARD